LTSVGNNFDREQKEEISVAEDEQTVERIEDGDIASAERKRNETILNHIRNQGTERELKKTVR
jgi:predicted carbohydrate-binding protein with CBM5 and CBM33 domain